MPRNHLVFCSFLLFIFSRSFKLLNFLNAVFHLQCNIVTTSRAGLICMRSCTGLITVVAIWMRVLCKHHVENVLQIYILVMLLQCSFLPLILILDAFPHVCVCASKSALNSNIASINEMALLLSKASTLLCSFFVASKQLSVNTVSIHF